MSPWLRNVLYLSLGLLWLTGCTWLVLHLFVQRITDFGTTLHPWQPGLLVAHGIIAVVAVFFFGWVSGTHVETRWRRGMSRMSGFVLMALASVLVFTGFSNYYITAESFRAGTAGAHEVLGALIVVPALMHWLSGRRNRA